MRETTFHSIGERMEEATGKGKEIEDSSSHQPTPWKRGRPRLIKKPEETQAPSEPHTQSAAERLLMHVVQLEPVEGSSRGIGERRRRSGMKTWRFRSHRSKLKQAQLTIAELYQENRELRRQLAERTVEMQHRRAK
jgi:hypothetical protein